ncbi:MAG: M28 family peptidase, partial [Nitrososphaerales archaeon]
IVLCFTHEVGAASRGPTAPPGTYLPLVTLGASPGGSAVPAFPPVEAPDPVVRWMVDQVKQDQVRQYEGVLSGERPVTIDGKQYRIQTRYVYSQEPISVTTRYAGDHLAGLGLDVEYQLWGPAAAPNVIGERTGVTRPGDIFMVTAHLDDMPTGSTAPGADDNASGSTAVLIAADILSQFEWDCTLRFALFNGEERGLLGSDAYAQRAKSKGENIAAVFNLDMIGWNAPGSPRDIDLHAKRSLAATVDLANQAASTVGAYGIPLIPEVCADGSVSSDHASFWKYSYTAILGIEDYYPNSHDFDPYYHSPGDTLSTLDLDYLTDYVKLVVAETAHMAGCLTTGAVQGLVIASHDGSPIRDAEIRTKDPAGREYALSSDANGRYSRAVPPETYTAWAAAYGYDSTATSNVSVTANGNSTQDFVLTASVPVAPLVAVTLDGSGITLAWPHVSPNIAYEVHESTAPYFTSDAGTRLAVVDAAHPPAPNEILKVTRARNEQGDLEPGHYYIVRGINAARASAASGQMSQFNFSLIRPDQASQAGSSPGKG